MGNSPNYCLQSGQTVKIWTGGMVPKGADAVVMIEYSHVLDEETVELAKAVSPLENIIQAGDDVKEGKVLLQAGSKLRPQDIGILAGLGIYEVPVYRSLKAAVIATGDEIIDLNEPLLPGVVRDINSYSIGGLLRELGVTPVYLGIVPDKFESIRDKVNQGLQEADMVLLSGGSSMGTRDYTVKVFESFPETQLLVHGISIKPGKPTILGKKENKALWGLPGHAVSAMVIFTIFVRPLIRLMAGYGNYRQGLAVEKAMLERNLDSALGLEEYVRVRIVHGNKQKIARPIFGKSGLISTMVEADGLVCIPMEAEGLYKGDTVEVMLFDPLRGSGR